MKFVKSLDMFHLDAKEIPCLTAKGTPTEKTEGAPGVLYMDTDTGDLYKCTGAADGVYTWKALVEQNSSSDSPQNVNAVEPAEDDIPKVFFGGALQQTKDEAVVPFSYRSKTLSFDCYAEIKAQGNSTMSWPKKNQTIKLYTDADCTEKLKINFKGWGKQNKFVIKANWRDLTHVRDIVSVRLEGDCMRTNPDYDELPELLKTSPNMGGIDGFPVVVYAAGIYQGRYMWNIPKDAWMANMDDELYEHCILCSEGYNSGCFRAAADINGNDWTDEIHKTVPASIKTRWNEVISFVMNSTDEEFVANLDSYIKVSTLIDRHLMGLLSCDFDGYGKNQLYITYDGQQWYANRYDKDGTWGNFWNGNTMLSPNYGREQYEDMTAGDGNLLFIRLEQLYCDRLQERWAELKEGPLSIPNIINRFRELYDITPPYLIEEDYASTTANGAFTEIPNKDICTIQQIQKFVVDRHAWTDAYIAGLTETVVPCTGITLDKTELTLTGAGSYTLTATAEPENTTSRMVWRSSDNTVAEVSEGVVNPLRNGSCVITATCGDYSAECAVTVEGISESTALYPLYSGTDIVERTTVTVTSGNHIKVEGIGTSTAMPAISGTDILSWIDDADTWFTIPKGATVEMRFYNISKTNGVSLAGNMRSISNNGVFGTTDTGDDGSIIRTATMAAETNVKFLYLSISSSAADSTLEFDVELLVNGEKWI